MRPAVFILLFVAFALTASTQITFLPQLGFENSRTKLIYNDLKSFLPMGNQLSPMLSLRIDYKFKQGHGPFLGVSTSQSSVYYTFYDPETGMNAYEAMRGNLQLQLEGGYQLSTNRIFLSKSSSTKKSTQASTQKNSTNKTYGEYSYRSRCGNSVARSHCGEKSNKTQSVATNRCGEKKSNKTQPVLSKVNRWFVRIQPSAGLAFIPSPEGNMAIKTSPTQTIYQYKAGNWNSAFITGAAFEFGQNVQRKFTVSINYLRGLGNLATETISTMVGSKPSVATMSSKVSSWNFAVGIPLSFSKKSITNQKIEKKNCQQRCGQYKIRSL